MGFLPDKSHLKNQYAAGTMWRPGSASQPPAPTMFAPKQTGFVARVDPGFSMGWREQVQTQRGQTARKLSVSIEQGNRRLERKIAQQELACLDRNIASHELMEHNRLQWQRHISRSQQRHEQQRFVSELVRNEARRPPDRLVETRNPPTMVIAGRLDGRGCEWFAPRPDYTKPFAMPKEMPYAPMGGMTPMARPLPKIPTAYDHLNFENGEEGAAS